MASNVFGTPVTDEMLKGLVRYYDKTITQADLAKVALEMKNSEGKDQHARKMAEYLKDRFGDSVATMGLIYNATGAPMVFVRDYEWVGHLCESPYPSYLQNGQWGVFVHGKIWMGDNYSKAAVVYSGMNTYNQKKHWCLAWANNRAIEGSRNRVYVEIRDTDHYEDGTMEPLRECLDDYGDRRVAYMADEYGGLVFGSIGDDKVTVVEAIMTLPDAAY